MDDGRSEGDGESCTVHLVSHQYCYGRTASSRPSLFACCGGSASTLRKNDVCSERANCTDGGPTRKENARAQSRVLASWRALTTVCARSPRDARWLCGALARRVSDSRPRRPRSLCTAAACQNPCCQTHGANRRRAAMRFAASTSALTGAPVRRARSPQ